MDKEVPTFRDKLGMVLMTSGIMLLMFVAFVLLGILLTCFIWLFRPGVSLPGVAVYQFLLILAFAGIALIRLSFYTVKK